jgi:hypothetical protein
MFFVAFAAHDTFLVPAASNEFLSALGTDLAVSKVLVDSMLCSIHVLLFSIGSTISSLFRLTLVFVGDRVVVLLVGIM